MPCSSSLTRTTMWCTRFSMIGLRSSPRSRSSIARRSRGLRALRFAARNAARLHLSPADDVRIRAPKHRYKLLHLINTSPRTRRVLLHSKIHLTRGARMKTMIAGVLAAVALSGCVAVPYDPGPGAYYGGPGPGYAYGPPPPVYYGPPVSF